MYYLVYLIVDFIILVQRFSQKTSAIFLSYLSTSHLLTKIYYPWYINVYPDHWKKIIGSNHKCMVIFMIGRWHPQVKAPYDESGKNTDFFFFLHFKKKQ